MTITQITPSEIQSVKANRLSVLRYVEARAAGWSPHFAVGVAGRRTALRRLPLATALQTGAPRDDFYTRETQRIIAAANG